MRRLYFILFFAFAGFMFVNAQGLKKQSEIFEYQSAAYDAVSNEVSISMKNSSGVIKQFLYKDTDETKAEAILFNPISSLQNNANLLTKNELVGKKYTIEYVFIGTSSSENKCCRKIKACLA